MAEESFRGEAVSMKRNLFLDRHAQACWVAQGRVSPFRSPFIQFKSLGQFCFENLEGTS